LSKRQRIGTGAVTATLVAAIGGLALSMPHPAVAAHPLVTEDTATQGTANVEIENGFSFARLNGSVFEYQPQLSLGITPTLDLVVQPSYVAAHSAGMDVRGLGDSNLDMKWRFFGSKPWSFAVRAGLALPTNQHDLGLPGSVSKHALLVLTYDEAPLTVHFNAGMVVNPDMQGLKRNLGHFSTALMWAVNEKLILTAEAAADANPDPGHSWGGSTLTGIIFTARPGLDLDFGFQYHFDSAIAPRTWLGGITYRFAF
jgi:hypothetical protein